MRVDHSIDKTCTTCGETKQIEEFGIKRSTADGHNYQCRKCVRIYQKGRPKPRARTNRNVKLKKIRAFKKSHRINGTAWLMNLKNNSRCLICGEDHPHTLDFHHRDPATKVDTISNMARVDKKTLIKEVAKCVILCANCHRKHHAGDLPLPKSGGMETRAPNPLKTKELTLTSPKSNNGVETP
jgi:hypothetical protein